VVSAGGAAFLNNNPELKTRKNIMKNIQAKLMAALIAASALCLCATSTQAQPTDPNQSQNGRQRGGGNRFDPAQFQQRRMDDLKEKMEIKDDTEWKALEPMIQKVMDAQTAAFRDRIRQAFGGGGRNRDRGGNNNNGSSSGDQRSRGGFGSPSAEADALEKAIEGKAPASELKIVLTKYNEARKARQAELETAQANLRKVLTLRQEAIATASGIL
jgi:hypothetical protein